MRNGELVKNVSIWVETQICQILNLPNLELANSRFQKYYSGEITGWASEWSIPYSLRQIYFSYGSTAVA